MSVEAKFRSNDDDDDDYDDYDENKHGEMAALIVEGNLDDDGDYEDADGNEGQDPPRRRRLLYRQMINTAGDDSDWERQRRQSLFLHLFFAFLMPVSLFGMALILGFFALTEQHNKKQNMNHHHHHHDTMKNHSTTNQIFDPFPASDVSIRLNRPPLETLIKRNDAGNKATEIRSDAQVDWILDFAIIGFPKCGTSSLKAWLGQASSKDYQESVYLDDHEVYSISDGHPGQLVQHFYKVMNKLENDNKDVSKVRFGIKNPRDIDSVHSLGLYQKHFPNTRLIVQLRHPVLWFQSIYNFRLRSQEQKGKHHRMPPPDKLIGPCTLEYPNASYSCSKSWDRSECHQGNNVCTNRAKFHHSISRLGLTPLNTTQEWDLLNHHDMSLHPTSQPVFFLELSQMFGKNDALRLDLQNFLNLPSLPPMPTYHTPYTKVNDEIDICQQKYANIRKVLVQHGRDASRWILEYLLKSPQAIVSSREEFIGLVEKWKVDPCDETKEKRIPKKKDNARGGNN